MCIKCFDKISHITRDTKGNKFATTKCPCCQTLNISDFNSFSKDHLLYTTLSHCVILFYVFCKNSFKNIKIFTNNN